MAATRLGEIELFKVMKLPARAGVLACVLVGALKAAAQQLVGASL